MNRTVKPLPRDSLSANPHSRCTSCRCFSLPLICSNCSRLSSGSTISFQPALGCIAVANLLRFGELKDLPASRTSFIDGAGLDGSRNAAKENARDAACRICGPPNRKVSASRSESFAELSPNAACQARWR